MNIVIITQYYKPEIGAPQNRLEEMALGLKALGNKVEIVSGMPNYPTGKIFEKYKNKVHFKDQINDLLIHRYWLYASNSKRILPRILSMFSFSLSTLFSYIPLRRLKPDFIIVESPPLILPLSALILSKTLGAKLIMNVSDLWPLSAKELGAISDGFTYRVLERLERFLYDNSDLCMGQSEEIIDYISERTNTSTFLYRNGVNPLRFNQRNILPVPRSKEGLKIVYAGLIGFAQGILDLCKNMDFKKHNMEFHIYGVGGESNELITYLSSCDKGIFYHGHVNSEEIPLVLSKADFTLIPLVKKIFGAVPSKIYESMAAGTPIIFIGEGEGAKIVNKYNLGWTLSARDYNALDKLLGKINKERKTANLREVQKNCIRCSTEIFNRPAQVKKLNDYIFKKIK